MKNFSGAHSFNYSFMPPRERKTGLSENSFHHISHPDFLIGLSLPSVGIGNCSFGAKVVVSLNQCKGIPGSPALFTKQYESKYSKFSHTHKIPWAMMLNRRSANFYRLDLRKRDRFEKCVVLVTSVSSTVSQGFENRCE